MAPMMLASREQDLDRPQSRRSSAGASVSAAATGACTSRIGARAGRRIDDVEARVCEMVGNWAEGHFSGFSGTMRKNGRILGGGWMLLMQHELCRFLPAIWWRPARPLGLFGWFPASVGLKSGASCLAGWGLWHCADLDRQANAGRSVHQQVPSSAGIGKCERCAQDLSNSVSTYQTRLANDTHRCQPRLKRVQPN